MLDLPDGQWADLREWLTHGERKTVVRAFLAADKDALDGPDIATALVRAYVADWRVLGRDGHELPVGDVDDAPGEVVDAITAAALDLWTARADPNASGGS